MGRFRLFSALTAAALATACNGSTTVPAPSGSTLQPIQHIVIMVQENRSFNNVFAGFPGADTAMQGPCKPAKWCTGSHMVTLHSVKLESNGSPSAGKDIDHSHRGFEIECAANKAKICQNDGFDLIHYGQSGGGVAAMTYPYAYIDRTETAPYWKLAQQYTLADEMFFTETASSFIAHQMLLSGTVRLNDKESLTDQPEVTPWGCDAPPHTPTAVIFTNGKVSEFGGPFPCFTQYGTIADLLDAANVSWQFYVDAMFSTEPHYDFSGAVWNGYDAIKKIRYGPDWKKNISIPNTNIFTDVKAGTLPAVSWVIPTLFDSDHPASGCNGGPRWVTKVVNALGTSQYWKNTAILLLWDDWGGWYDNVPPAQINYTSLGFRVPIVIISPYAKPGYVSHTQYDFGSILKFVEQTFGLGSLGTTDAPANSLADAFDFTQTPNTFHPAAIPHANSCADEQVDGSATRRLIEHDGGIPE